MPLCLVDLAELTGGTLRLAAMPPRDGELTAVHRIVLSPEEAVEGDIFWRLGPQVGDSELAFLRGALAVAMTGPAIEPWPGRASLQIANPGVVLADLIAALTDQREEFLLPASELKVLQLSPGRRFCIPPSAHLKCRTTKVKCRMHDE
jgi:hypothetical protein